MSASFFIRLLLTPEEENFQEILVASIILAKNQFRQKDKLRHVGGELAKQVHGIPVEALSLCL